MVQARPIGGILEHRHAVCFDVSMRIRAVSLDVGWTLAYPRESMWEIFADVCRGAGVAVSAEETESMVRSLWLVGQRRAEEHLRSGGQYSDSDEEFAAQFRFLGQLIFGQLGVRGDTETLMEEFFRRFWQPDQWQVFPDALDTIRTLRALGLRVGVLSNAPSDMPKLLDRLGILPYLDYVVISAREGTRKPDRRIFQRAIELAGASADQVVHVGDMYVEDVLGGRHAGVHTFLIERGKHALFPNHAESEGRNLADLRVLRSLAEFVDRVRDLL